MPGNNDDDDDDDEALKKVANLGQAANRGDADTASEIVDDLRRNGQA